MDTTRRGRCIVTAWVLAGVLCSSATAAPPQAAAQISGTVALGARAELTAFVDSVVLASMREERVPGGAVAIVRNGRVEVLRGYGLANVDRRTPVVPDRTLFRLGSITKVLTATAVMQLADQGGLDLQRDVNAYLRDFNVPATYRDPVTAAHLLTHTAGFDEINRGRRASNAASVRPLRAYLPGRLVRVRPPGEISSYGTYGMALAGHLVEAVSGVPYAVHLQRRVFAPLGMTRSGVASVPPELAADLATGYVYSRGHYVARRFEHFHTSPASDANSTASDMAQFMMAHLGAGSVEGGRMLSAGATAEMHRRQFTHHPRLAGWAYGFRELFQNGHRALWHGGGMEGYAALLFLIPSEGWGVFIAANRETAMFGERVKNALMDREFPYRAQPDPALPADAPLGSVARFAGTYRSTERCHSCRGLVDAWVDRKLAPKFAVTANADNTLSLWGERLIQVEPLLFKVAGDRGYVVFQTDRAGRVRYLFAGQSAYESVR